VHGSRPGSSKLAEVRDETGPGRHFAADPIEHSLRLTKNARSKLKEFDWPVATGDHRYVRGQPYSAVY
jgi:hypothetical protein